ncbi:hypothetical protein ABKN59_000869 [Abortiporus biennis]
MSIVLLVYGCTWFKSTIPGRRELRPSERIQTVTVTPTGLVNSYLAIHRYKSDSFVPLIIIRFIRYTELGPVPVHRNGIMRDRYPGYSL